MFYCLFSFKSPTTSLKLTLSLKNSTYRFLFSLAHFKRKFFFNWNLLLNSKKLMLWNGLIFFFFFEASEHSWFSKEKKKFILPALSYLKSSKANTWNFPLSLSVITSLSQDKSNASDVEYILTSTKIMPYTSSQSNLCKLGYSSSLQQHTHKNWNDTEISMAPVWE